MKKQKTLLIVSVLIVISGLFYWFQVRPSQIKHNCSWVAKHEDAVLERPAMTKGELLKKGMIQNCDILVNEPSNPNSSLLGELATRRKQVCEGETSRVVDSYKNVVPAKPARDWYEASTDQEYKFCLRDKGL